MNSEKNIFSSTSKLVFPRNIKGGTTNRTANAIIDLNPTSPKRKNAAAAITATPHIQGT
ncbi:hypothetical protein HYU17_02370 [Candidatus Woesearchaeota archaeon]|nr:hypothetical protein [Candidatus Woesearchaeota archaeon]